MNMKCMIIDDEEIARKGLQRYVEQVPYLDLVNAEESALTAINTIVQEPVDLVFLDIHMPKLNGLDFLKTLKAAPLVIITTAYPNYALESFELDVIDYLVKPFSFERFLKACNKCKEYFELKNHPAAPGGDYFFVKSDNKIEKIRIADILFVQAMENYVSICTSKKKYLTLISLKTIENHLDKKDFLKAQKSFIVSKSGIEGIEGNMIIIGNYKIPISRQWKEEIIKELVSNKLLKR